VSTLMAKECRKLLPSTDLQCIAITPGAPLSPSPKNEKKKKKKKKKHVKTLVEEIFFIELRENCLNLYRSGLNFFSQKMLVFHPLKSTADTGDHFEDTACL
jgi:hypothetical protein